MNRWLLHALFVGAVSLACQSAQARDAAFVDPGIGNGNVAVEDSIKVEPKNDVDIGDATLNVARRLTLFFTNQTVVPVKIEKIAVNADSSVTAEISNDDCTKQSTLAPGTRCSVELSVTPINPGPWSVEVLMTHSGAGRITRAKVSGKTPGATAEKKDDGLSLSTKDIKPVDFGEVSTEGGKAVRSALMVNDSPTAITLYSIDVIEAENGLQKLDQGCAVDMELKPGESCPVTLIWAPTAPGQISTDLIIRHSGQLGFAVIPIRGTTKAVTVDNAKSSKDTKTSSQIAPPPSAQALEKVLTNLPAMSSTMLAAPINKETGISAAKLHLIGTVGNRALLLKPDGSTAVAQAGDTVELDSSSLKVLSVTPKAVEIEVGGKKKQLPLEAAPELTDRARAARMADKGAGDNPSGGSGASDTSSGGLGFSAPANQSAPQAATLPATASGLGGMH